MQEATPVRVADGACVRCHQQIYRNYLSTPMANASGAARDNLKPAAFLHKPSGVTYTISQDRGNAMLRANGSGANSSSWEQPLTYFLGSGHLGITYLYFIDRYLFESPAAWYASSRGYDMKPGLEDLRQPPPALASQSSCLRCHMSAVQPGDPGTINRYRNLPFLHTGITCESCHGDTSQHVLSAGKTRAVDPSRLSAEKRDSVCISCHLEGDVSVERAGVSALNYRPGDSISSYLAFYVRAGADLTARGVSEVEQLSRSTCKRVSGDKMSCTSCHDPHFTPAPEQRAGFYRRKCLACHTGTTFAASHHPENPDCTSCHMQRTGAANIPHVAWTDHRILRLPENSNLSSQGAAANELVPIFSPGTTSRDEAMAYYQLLQEGGRRFDAAALEKLTKLGDSILGDKAALDALGKVSAEHGDFHSAERAFRRVTELDPADLDALSNLGVVAAKQGRLSEAIQLLQRAFENNKDIPSLAMNLARVECAAGDDPAALSTLRDALVFNPGLEELQQFRSTILDHTAGCAAPAGKP
jgi:predicted CXXCH cytochrome family protein